jgi:hypothetical protein
MPDNLPATTTKSRTLTPGLLLSEKLSTLVLSGDNPVVGPRTASALRAFAAEPEPPLAERSQVDVMISKLAIATAQPKVSPKEAAERLNLYWRALGDLPLVDLGQAFDDLLRASTFLPTPAEVRKAAMHHTSRRRYAKSRARHLVWKHEREWKPSADVVPPDELRALLAETKVGTPPQRKEQTA